MLAWLRNQWATFKAGVILGFTETGDRSARQIEEDHLQAEEIRKWNKQIDAKRRAKKGK